MAKIFEVTVLDESAQSSRIMDVHGYSNLSAGVDYAHRAGRTYRTRTAYITGWTSKARLQAEVRRVLGSAYWPSLNAVELHEVRRAPVHR